MLVSKTAIVVPSLLLLLSIIIKVMMNYLSFLYLINIIFQILLLLLLKLKLMQLLLM